jgi:uncharacterized protein HemY
MLANLGKVLILVGLGFIVLGLIFIAGVRIPWLGKLPGDIYIQKKNFSFYFPLTTCLFISVVLSAIFWLLSRR